MMNVAPRKEVDTSIEIDKDILSKIITADTFHKLSPEEQRRLQDAFDFNQDKRELQVYKLLRKIVADLNDRVFRDRKEKLRIYDEGNGLFMDLS